MNLLFPKIINIEINTNNGIPRIKDQTAKLKFPTKNSSIISAIMIIETNIITLITPRKVLTMRHICSESLTSSGLSRAESLSMKDNPPMFEQYNSIKQSSYACGELQTVVFSQI